MKYKDEIKIGIMTACFCCAMVMVYLDMNEEHVADCYLTVQAQSKDSADFVL